MDKMTIQTSALPAEGQSSQERIPQLVPRGPHLLTFAWIFFLSILSQLPFRRIWFDNFAFPYDASTTFSYWNVARLRGLREGDAVLGFFHVGVPSEVWPSYFFTGIIRQLAALIQPNTAAAHAVLQAFHGALLVPAVALLLRSFGVPMHYGAIGGLVYVLAGIHASVTQHVYSYEALVYLVLSLWSMREFALGARTRSNRVNVAVLLACGIVLTSLVRVHHEAIIYMPAMLGWALYHLWLAGDEGRSNLGRVFIGFSCLAIFVAVCSVPMLMATYDLSVINKTQPYTYEALSPYFSDPRVFALSFFLPEFTSDQASGPSPFSFGTDATLAYTFAGTLSAALYVTTVVLRARDGRWKDLVALVILPFVLLLYTFGPDNVVHRGITFLFPFLVGIGHSFYGLHLFYLLVAFGVAEGVRHLAAGRGWSYFLGLQGALLALVFYLSIRAIAQAGFGWGFSGSLNSFASSIQDDTRYAALVSLAAAVILMIALVARRMLRATLRRIATPAVVLLGFTALISADLVRPLIGARFLPGPLGDVPAEQVASHIEQRLSQLPSHPPQRAMVIGGWRSNALLPLGVRLLQTPGDTGGNKFVSTYAGLPPSEDLITLFIEEYGVTLFWAERGFDSWHRTLSESPQLRHGFHYEWGGDVYWVKDPAATPPGLVASWNSPEVVITDGIVRRTWRFPETQAEGGVSLPLLWHPGYRISAQDGQSLEYGPDEFGRVRVVVDEPTTLVAEYPNRILAFLVVLSALVYLAWLLTLAILAFGLAAAFVRRVRVGAPTTAT